jgi:hypothetical protein
MTKRTSVSVIVALLLSADVAIAGPIADAARRAAARIAQPASDATTTPGKNKLLLPGLCILGVGSAIALYGFTHATGGDVIIPPDFSGISVSEKHATGVGVAGLVVAGVGTLVIWKGANDAKRHAVTVGSRTIRYTVRF